MLLFPSEPVVNLLPQDGIALYYGSIIEPALAQDYFHKLMQTIAWKNDEVLIYGKHITTKRKVAWYGDQTYPYTYSHITREALPWTKELLALKSTVEEIGNTSFNACLLNLYHHGEEGMGWHSDDEKSIEKNSAIASVSFGAERKFSFKHKEHKISTSLLLENGSLLLMKGETQTHWWHSLPKTKKVKEARINLTFRKMMGA
jgi:alkylated DNA repair dioxygenase AlkB